MRKFKSHSRGFTLLELLVVIIVGFVILVCLFFLVALIVYVARHAFG